MTLKEISKLTGKTKRTVELWASKLCENNSQVREKISQAKITNKASDFNIHETLDIIRAGGNDTLANLLLDNHKQSIGIDIQSSYKHNDTLDNKIDKLFSIVERQSNMIDSLLKISFTMNTNSNQLSLPEIEYYSLKGYCNKLGIKRTASELSVIGKQLTHISKTTGKEVKRLEDEMWGTVNGYHITLLKEVFNEAE